MKANVTSGVDVEVYNRTYGSYTSPESAATLVKIAECRLFTSISREYPCQLVCNALPIMEERVPAAYNLAGYSPWTIIGIFFSPNGSESPKVMMER